MKQKKKTVRISLKKVSLKELDNFIGETLGDLLVEESKKTANSILGSQEYAYHKGKYEMGLKIKTHLIMLRLSIDI